MIKTKEELKEQAEKIGLKKWKIHNCSMCDYPCGYIIGNTEVWYEHLTESYNMNQPEKNPKISAEYLKELNEIWKF
jgi:hypothetical protein